MNHRQFFQCCKPLFEASLFTLCAVVALETGRTHAAPVAKLEDWRFYPEALQLEITLSAASQPRHFYLSQPPRIVVDLPDTQLGYVPTRQNYSGAIQSIRVSQLNADVTRIVIDLAPGTFLEPSLVQLQPVSWKNSNRWVLRPLIANNRTYSPPGNFPRLPNNLPQRNFPLPLSDNLPPSFYNSPPLPNNPPSGNLPPSVYNSPFPPSNVPAGNFPQPQGNFPSNTYNNAPSSTFNIPPTFTPQPPTINNNFPQQPFIQVPSLSPDNPSQLPSPVLPPARFPNQFGDYNNNIPPVRTPNSAVPPIPNYRPIPDFQVIEFGQPLPNR